MSEVVTFGKSTFGSSERAIWAEKSGSRIMELASHTLIRHGSQGEQAALIPFILASRLGHGGSFDESFSQEVGLDQFCFTHFTFIRDSLLHTFAGIRNTGLSNVDFVQQRRLVAVLKSVKSYCPAFLQDIQSQGIFLALSIEIRTPSNVATNVSPNWPLEVNLAFLAGEKSDKLRAVNLQVQSWQNAPRGGLATRQWIWDMGRQISASDFST